MFLWQADSLGFAEVGRVPKDSKGGARNRLRLVVCEPTFDQRLHAGPEVG